MSRVSRQVGHFTGLAPVRINIVDRAGGVSTWMLTLVTARGPGPVLSGPARITHAVLVATCLRG